MSASYKASNIGEGALTICKIYHFDVNRTRAVDRLLKIVKTPHPVPEVCRKTSMILESLVSEPQNRMHLLVHENTFAEILTSEGKYSDTFARIVYELTARPSNKVTSGHAIWGNIN